MMLRRGVGELFAHENNPSIVFFLKVFIEEVFKKTLVGAQLPGNIQAQLFEFVDRIQSRLFL